MLPTQGRLRKWLRMIGTPAPDTLGRHPRSADLEVPVAHNFMSILTGSFAKPAAENPTVAVMDAAYAHHGMQARYINCEVGPEALEDAVRGAVAMGFAGFNCSIPNKIAVMQYLDALAPSAEIIGAVNTVVITDGRLTGHNTDGQGFVESLRTVADPAGKTMVVFGAGGAARAIAVESALEGAAAITIVNRDAKRGSELAALVNDRTNAKATFVEWDHPYAITAGTDIVVNATSIGLFPDSDARLNIDIATLGYAGVVADVIHNPPITHLLRDAATAGCTTLDGRGMLVNQARVNIRLWTGVDADGAVMRAVLNDLFD